VAVLASVFSREGSTLTGQGFVDGLVPAIWIGAVVLAGGALLALAVPGRRSGRPVVEAASPAGREPELALDLSAS
jgi:cytochrome c biogenesis factor